MDVPQTTSGCIPLSASASMTPMCDQPRADPLPNAKPIFMQTACRMFRNTRAARQGGPPPHARTDELSLIIAGLCAQHPAARATRHASGKRDTCLRAFCARQAGPGLTARPRAVRGAFFSPLHHLLSAQRNAFPLSFLPRIGYKAPLTRRTLPDASGRIPGMTPGG